MRVYKIAATFLGLVSGFLAMTQPANDDPCGAIPLIIAQNEQDCTPVPFNITVAPTNTSDLPSLPPCSFQWSTSTSRDVWYKFEPITTELAIKFVALHSSSITYFHTDYVIYSAGDCNEPFNFNYITCGTNYSLGGPVLLSDLIPGMTYYLRVFVSPTSTGTHDICLFSDMPLTIARTGINTSLPEKNFDVSGNAQFRNGVVFKRNVNVMGSLKVGAVTASNIAVSGKGNFSSIGLSSDLGNRIGLYGDMTTGHYGIGIQAGLLQLYGDASTSQIGFGYGSSSTFTERMRISNGGPIAMMLNGRFLINHGEESPGIWFNNNYNTDHLGLVGTYNNTSIGIYSKSLNNWGLTVDMSTNNVGIGTVTAHAPLTFLTSLGKKISFFNGVNGDAAIGVYGNEFRLQSDYPNADITFGNDNISTGFRENMRLSNPTGALHVRGAVFANASFYSSDATLKQHILPIPDALKSVLGLTGYQYEWKNTNAGEGLQMGVIAQEVEKLFPHLVERNQYGTLAVNYNGLVSLLINAMKEQQQQIDELKILVKQLVDKK